MNGSDSTNLTTEIARQPSDTQKKKKKEAANPGSCTRRKTQDSVHIAKPLFPTHRKTQTNSTWQCYGKT